MPKLFAYGTLQSPRLQKIFFGKTIKGQSARLHGVKHVGGDYDKGEIPMIATTSVKGSYVDGKVYEVPKDVVPRLDSYEGNGYRRVSMAASYVDGTPMDTVYVYVRNDF